MTITEMIINRKAWDWAMEWVEYGNKKIIEETASEIKDEYCTNGLWNPDAEIAYLMLTEAAEM